MCAAGDTEIVSSLNVRENKVMCDVTKAPPPLMAASPHTIFEGPNWSGKAEELLFANFDCNVYGPDPGGQFLRGVRGAMRDLGGRRQQALAP